MTCDNPTWITYSIYAVLFLAGFLCISVMQKAEHNPQIIRIDAKWIRNGRRMSFIAITMLAWAAILTDISQLSILLLFIATAVLLIIDTIALDQRPPASYQQYSVRQQTSPRKLFANIFSRHHH